MIPMIPNRVLLLLIAAVGIYVLGFVGFFEQLIGFLRLLIDAVEAVRQLPGIEVIR